MVNPNKKFKRGQVMIPFRILEEMIKLKENSVRTVYADPNREAIIIVHDDDRYAYDTNLLMEIPMNMFDDTKNTIKES